MIARALGSLTLSPRPMSSPLSKSRLNSERACLSCSFCGKLAFQSLYFLLARDRGRSALLFRHRPLIRPLDGTGVIPVGALLVAERVAPGSDGWLIVDQPVAVWAYGVVNTRSPGFALIDDCLECCAIRWPLGPVGVRLIHCLFTNSDQRVRNRHPIAEVLDVPQPGECSAACSKALLAPSVQSFVCCHDLARRSRAIP